MAFGKETDPHVGASTQFQPGESGNPAGMKKGYKHISTYIQKYMDNPKFEATILDAKTGITEYKGAPMQAIVQIATTKAVNGDQKWADWLAKYGYGTKMTLANDEDNPITGTMNPAEAAAFAEFLKNKGK